LATGETVTDLHRHFIDHLELPSKQGKGPLKRIPDVFDCWFESGSMPYAQARHHCAFCPLERSAIFRQRFTQSLRLATVPMRGRRCC
jgi:isoleucyl-tRNA synthetase